MAQDMPVEGPHPFLIENLVQAVWETDRAGFVAADSPSWRAYTGQTREQWLGYGWLNAIHPDDRAFAERQWREAMAAHSNVNAEFRLRAPGGGWRWTNVRATPVLNASGTIEKWAGLNVDIDDRKRAEEALRASEEKYRTLFETLGQGYAECELIRGADGHAVDIRYLALNPALERLSGGLKAADMIGRPTREVIPDIEETHATLYERIVDGGVPERVEYEVAALGRWYECYVYPIQGDRFISLYEDITERKRAEALLRESEERQAFLLEFSDVLRAERSADAMADRAIRMIFGKLGLDRCYLATYETEKDRASITHQFGNDQTPAVPAAIRLSDFPEAFRVVFDHTLVIEDVLADESLSRVDRDNILRLGMRGLMAATLRKGPRRPLWVIVAVSVVPRRWTPSEIALVEEVAERTWIAVERARAEAAQRESEERFRQFANASAAGLWIRDARTLQMEFVSPAVAAIYGVEADALLGGVERWAAVIVPDDRDIALRHLQEACEGKSVAHEFRIQRRSDRAFRWIRNTDFPLRDGDAVLRIGGIAEDITEARLATEHQAVLLAELQHRVRNIMAMTRSVTQRTARNAQDVPEYAALMSGRLMSLARTQALLTRGANVSVDLQSLLHTELAAQANDEGQYSLSGPRVEISPKAAEVLSLSIHELATNALKYGAFSVAEGKIDVVWHVSMEGESPVLRLLWTETRPAIPNWTPPTRRGFGSELVERRVPYELDGEGKVELTPEGARVSIAFPLQPGASILETSAPARKSVYGGSIDMSGEQLLAGQRVLVVEDDYLLAYDTQSALESAGATVVGPFKKEEEAFAAIRESDLSAALTDINLGRGPSFEIANRLMRAEVPFAFLTGYDQDAIPKEFAEVPRFVKPIDTRKMVRELSRLLNTTKGRANDT